MPFSLFYWLKYGVGWVGPNDIDDCGRLKNKKEKVTTLPNGIKIMGKPYPAKCCGRKVAWTFVEHGHDDVTLEEDKAIEVYDECDFGTNRPHGCIVNGTSTVGMATLWTEDAGGDLAGKFGDRELEIEKEGFDYEKFERIVTEGLKVLTYRCSYCNRILRVFDDRIMPSKDSRRIYHTACFWKEWKEEQRWISEHEN